MSQSTFRRSFLLNRNLLFLAVSITASGFPSHYTFAQNAFGLLASSGPDIAVPDESTGALTSSSSIPDIAFPDSAVAHAGVVPHSESSGIVRTALARRPRAS